jgi:Uma2 family endonuclease
MSTMTQPVLVTTEELLALPDDGMERWLIRGELREKPMTKRNRWHARVEARIAHLLLSWLEQQPEPRGEVLSGEAGIRLRRNPDTTFGIDVIYVSAELAARNPADTTLIDGPPVLAVEVLSPSDTEEEINEKVEELLQGGVALVWLVDTHFETVQVFRPGAPPEMFNVRQELSAEPHLPGFRVRVAQIFGR